MEPHVVTPSSAPNVLGSPTASHIFRAVRRIPSASAAYRSTKDQDVGRDGAEARPLPLATS
jgi:hypothetical protein